MNGAIRLTDPARIGPALAEVRALLGMPRRQLARLLAERTGRSATSLNAQLWQWDNAFHAPDLASLPNVLDVLGYDLALIPPRTGDRSTVVCRTVVTFPPQLRSDTIDGRPRVDRPTPVPGLPQARLSATPQRRSVHRLPVQPLAHPGASGHGGEGCSRCPAGCRVNPAHPAELHARASLASLAVARDQLVVAAQRATSAAADFADLGTIQAWRPGTGGSPAGDRREPILEALLTHGTRRAQFTAEAERLQRVHETLIWLVRILIGHGRAVDPLAILLLHVPDLSPSAAATVTMWVDEQDQAARKLLGEPDDRVPIPGVACPACEMAGVLAYRTSAPRAEQVIVCTAGCECRGEDCPCGMPVRAAGVVHIWTRDQAEAGKQGRRDRG